MSVIQNNPVSKFFSNMRLSVKLPAVIISAAIITGLTISYTSEKRASDEMHTVLRDSFLTQIESRHTALTGFLGNIDSDLYAQARNPFMVSALQDFTESFYRLQNPKEYLQNQYIKNNPHPNGSKHELMYANDGSEYSSFHKNITHGLKTS
jgi:methyl-accepting chemotaxis protein